jgi:hypothetical protein
MGKAGPTICGSGQSWPNDLGLYKRWDAFRIQEIREIKMIKGSSLNNENRRSKRLRKTGSRIFSLDRRTIGLFKKDGAVQMVAFGDGRMIDNSCLFGLRWVKTLGCGAYGSVENVCQGDMCNYVLKIIPLDLPQGSVVRHVTDEATFWREAHITDRMGELGVGPKVVRAGICPDFKTGPTHHRVGFIQMEMFDVPLFRWKFAHPQLCVYQALEADQKFTHENGARDEYG